MSTAFAATAEEIRAADRVESDPLEELLAESDRLLHWLEQAKDDGKVKLPVSARDWLIDLSAVVSEKRLTCQHEAARTVQGAMDWLFDEIQPPILEWRARARGLYYEDTLRQLTRASYGEGACTCSCGPCVQARMGDTRSEHCGGTSCG